MGALEQSVDGLVLTTSTPLFVLGPHGPLLGRRQAPEPGKAAKTDMGYATWVIGGGAHLELPSPFGSPMLREEAMIRDGSPAGFNVCLFLSSLLPDSQTLVLS